MAGRRCALVCQTWPDEPAYHQCPACGQHTAYFATAVPLGRTEARAAAFEAYYQRHDATSDPARLQPGDDEARFDVPPLPEGWPVLDQHPSG